MTEYLLAYVTARGIHRGWLLTLGEPGCSNPTAGGNPYMALRFTDRADAERAAVEQSGLVHRFAHVVEVVDAPPAQPPRLTGR